MATSKERVICALDFPTAQQAVDMAERLRGEVHAVKVGFELFVAEGPALVQRLVELGQRVFLDLKMLDIPNTVEQAARAAARLGVWMINVHGLGGRHMLEGAVKAIKEESSSLLTPAPKLIAVTILTSMDDMTLAEVGLQGSPHQAALNLARLAQNCGLDGVVCSGREAEAIRRAAGGDFLLVTPGVRPASSDHNDQKRVMTPNEAIAAGASYLVIGRPITRAEDPVLAARTLFEETRQN